MIVTERITAITKHLVPVAFTSVPTVSYNLSRSILNYFELRM